MDIAGEGHLAKLKEDYRAVSGGPSDHFFCPILHVDEDVPLIRAHVINKAFPNSDRSWTVQRKDVDNFFGSRFEADFLAIDKKVGRSPIELLADKDLRRLFKPRPLLDGKEVKSYAYQPFLTVPEQFLEATLSAEGRSVREVFKPTPSQRQAAQDGRVEIEVDKDVRIHALVSLLKAAHLTLFHLMGYQYALSLGGRLLGKDLLGDLFFKARQLKPADTVEMAVQHFRPFHNMVQVVLPGTTPFEGTVTDRLANAILDGSRIWALQVFVRTGEHMYLVMAPILDHPDSVARFRKFLSAEESALECRSIRLNRSQIEMAASSFEMTWPSWEL